MSDPFLLSASVITTYISVIVHMYSKLSVAQILRVKLLSQKVCDGLCDFSSYCHIVLHGSVDK